MLEVTSNDHVVTIRTDGPLRTAKSIKIAKQINRDARWVVAYQGPRVTIDSCMAGCDTCVEIDCLRDSDLLDFIIKAVTCNGD